MKPAGDLEGLAFLAFVALMIVLGIVLAILDRRKAPTQVHRRGTKLLSKEDAQARADGKDGTP